MSLNTEWTKSSYSEGSGNACVEVAHRSKVVLVRDSKDVALTPFQVSSDAWNSFLPFVAR
ncbi:DUF397 domain-containing protein [Streptomyces sp. NPDC008125]|uniref:DUF397 domain-containing protein n=1 Tax=Streptomyces sp. NPDC008125 TaxID=3364811 RepID=UPI0036E61631